MSLIGHNTPPIFKRGPAPTVRLMLYVSAALVLLVTDLKFHYLEFMRQTVAVVLYPVERAAATPADLVLNAATYFATLAKVQQENALLRRQQLRMSEQLMRHEQLARENSRLRTLLGMREELPARSVAADVLYAAHDPFSRKVILDRGSTHGIAKGDAVVDERGVIGQVTRVHPIQAEVTLLTDKEQAIPIAVQRNGLRGVVFGAGAGQLELRYLPATADVEPGDTLVTSGLDGLYLPGLPVAKVLRVDRDTQAFARIFCAPVGGVEQSTQVLVMGRLNLPLPPMGGGNDAVVAKAGGGS